jgi:hypothetical protein
LPLHQTLYSFLALHSLLAGFVIICFVLLRSSSAFSIS